MSAMASAGTRARHHALALPLPRVGVSLAVSGGAAVSLAPSLLPRSAPVQGVLTGVLVAVLYGAVALIGRLRAHPGQATGARITALAVAGAVVTWAVVCADRWQNSLRAAMALPSVGAVHWAQVGLWAVAVFLVSVGITRGFAAAGRRLGGARSTALAVVVAALAWFVAVPGATSAAAQHFRATSTVVDPGLVAGDRDSLVPWTTLGAEGRRFVAGTSDPRSIRTYVGLDSAPDVNARAALAVRELDRTGAFTRGHVVVAVPTGSGWIDGEAARGIERRFGGDVAIVGQQYSYAPSWATFLFGRADAEASARALFAAVSAHIATLAPGERPSLHVYGQSLGSVGGSAIFDSDAAARPATCSVLWAGPPAGAVDVDGAAVLANSSDPVVWWSPALVANPPDLSRARVDAPVPQWIPFASFVQTTVDLVFALDAPTGHGHRYGIDQGLSMPAC
ncbi:alpha/beta-hydrolase family protein [Rhodococcus sp. ACT016]|uniref:alpha/beta-hydrolase family protein n=1 Tax=Rhodococcus sp. ACT016 TaxID=3134808 RepID=UPI003D285543